MKQFFKSMELMLLSSTITMGVQGLVSRDAGCCFGIDAYGGPGGPVGQLSDGQNRIGDSKLPPGEYCIGADGGLTDGKGRGCILTPPTTQWQCDVGAAPTPGFELSCNGTLVSPADSTTFFACPTEDNGGWNIYTEPVEGQPKCVPIWLRADSCFTGCETKAPPKPTPPPAPKPVPPPPAPKECPGELTGSWEFPHLIVPINADASDKAYGTSFNGTASGPISSIFSFDIPQSYAGKECTLEFLFPEQDQLETSAYEYSPGKFDFTFLGGVATLETDYDNAPESIYDFGQFKLTPGSATIIGKCPHGCPAGETVSFLMKSAGGSLNYFQDSNPCPIGLYITAV